MQSQVHNMSAVQMLRYLMESGMPDCGFGRCDGHHEMIDFRLEKAAACPASPAAVHQACRGAYAIRALPDLCFGIVSEHLDFPLGVLSCLKPRNLCPGLSFTRCVSAGTKRRRGWSVAHLYFYCPFFSSFAFCPSPPLGLFLPSTTPHVPVPRRPRSGVRRGRTNSWINSVDSIEPDADGGAGEDKAHDRLFAELTRIQGVNPRERGSIIEDGGRPCPEGNRRTHRQILAAAKRHCPSRIARVTEPSQLNICRSLSVFDQP